MGAFSTGSGMAFLALKLSGSACGDIGISSWASKRRRPLEPWLSSIAYLGCDASYGTGIPISVANRSTNADSRDLLRCSPYDETQFTIRSHATLGKVEFVIYYQIRNDTLLVVIIFRSPHPNPLPKGEGTPEPLVACSLFPLPETDWR